MIKDYVHKDCIIFKTGEIISAKEWRDSVRSSAPSDMDIKQFTFDKVMELLAILHSEVEEIQRNRLPEDYQD